MSSLFHGFGNLLLGGISQIPGVIKIGNSVYSISGKCTPKMHPAGYAILPGFRARYACAGNGHLTLKSVWKSESERVIAMIDDFKVYISFSQDLKNRFFWRGQCPVLVYGEAFGYPTALELYPANYSGPEQVIAESIKNTMKNPIITPEWVVGTRQLYLNAPVTMRVRGKLDSGAVISEEKRQSSFTEHHSKNLTIKSTKLVNLDCCVPFGEHNAYYAPSIKRRNFKLTDAKYSCANDVSGACSACTLEGNLTDVLGLVTCPGVIRI